MKLHELGGQRPTEQIAKIFNTHLGQSIDFTRLSESQAQRLLGKVRGLLKEYKTSVSRHFSERNPDYLRLVMLEQGLSGHLNEQTGAMAAINDPKTKAVMDKVKRSQELTPDEQKTMNKIALATQAPVTEKYQGFEKTVKSIAKGGSARDPEAVAAAIGRKKYGKERFQKAAAAGRKLGERRIMEASELQQAQVVLAAQDMIDRVQGMMEDISEMQFKDLPALVDSIKNDMGVEQSQQFQSEASAALSQLLTAVQAGKQQLEAAQGVLTGQAPQVPGSTEQPPAADQTGDLGADLDLDANLPPEEDEEEEEVQVDLGRERR